MSREEMSLLRCATHAREFERVDQPGQEDGRTIGGEKRWEKYKYREEETRGIDSLLLERRRRLRTSFSPVIPRKIAFAT